MKIFIILFIILSVAQSLGAADKPSAIALEWWLRTQGKFDGAIVCTKEINGKFEIIEWKVLGVSQPTNAEVEKIIKDYEKTKSDKRVEQQKSTNDLDYKQKRAREYPPAADYLDGIVKGDQAQIQKYIDDCKAVKAKYPKQ